MNFPNGVFPRGRILLELIKIKILMRPLPFYTQAYTIILRSAYSKNQILLFKRMFNTWVFPCSWVMRSTRNATCSSLEAEKRQRRKVASLSRCAWVLSVPLTFQMSRNPNSLEYFISDLIFLLLSPFLSLSLLPSLHKVDSINHLTSVLLTFISPCKFSYTDCTLSLTSLSYM